MTRPSGRFDPAPPADPRRSLTLADVGGNGERLPPMPEPKPLTVAEIAERVARVSRGTSGQGSGG